MSRGSSGRALRCSAVWGTTSAGTAAAVLAASGPVRDTLRARGQLPFDELFVGICAGALLAAACWLWILTSATVWQVMSDRPPRRAGAARRLVLLACGAALATGAAAPAALADDTGRTSLAGLPLPDRAVTQGAVPQRPPGPAATPVRSPRPAPTHDVRPGDSLWAIAAAHPAPGASIDERWRAIWAANDAVIGPDPDLIRPGQRLVLPDAHQAPLVEHPDRPNQ